MDKLKSEGKCFYCNETFAASGLSRHLKTHLKSIEKEKPTAKKSYHLKITGGKEYFLHLLIREDCELEELDTFLRRIWLECCGHLSSFEIKGAPKTKNWAFEEDYDDDDDDEEYDDDDEEFGISKSTKAGKLFKKGLKLNYEYDFGSTTALKIDVLEEYFIHGKDELLLLSRNEPLKILCDLCKKKPATVMCAVWHDDESMFCDSCKDTHAEQCADFEDYGDLIIVNSPRSGVCGYEGGTIDVERDGVWEQ